MEIIPRCQSKPGGWKVRWNEFRVKQSTTNALMVIMANRFNKPNGGSDWVFKGSDCESEGQRFSKALEEEIQKKVNQSFKNTALQVQKVLTEQLNFIRNEMVKKLKSLKCPKAALEQMLVALNPQLTHHTGAVSLTSTRLGNVSNKDYGGNMNWLASWIGQHDVNKVKATEFIITKTQVEN